MGHDWHAHHHHRYRRLGPLGRFVRSRLRRRLFAWFAISIAMTAVMIAAGMMMMSHGEENGWRSQYERGQLWVGKQFASRWDSPPDREAFARDTAKDLQLNLQLLDPGGAALLTVGAVCAAGSMDAPVLRNGVQLGTVRACAVNRSGPGAGRAALLLLAVVLVLWVASGRIARRLARPLDELATVVKRIGGGDLKARAVLSASAQDEIGVVADAVNEMAGRIEKQITDQRELLATVSHELRTPLARIRLVSEIARDGGATPKTFDDLDREVVEMDALVGELLANSRVDFGLLQVRELSAKDAGLRALERAGLPADRLAVDGVETIRADPTLLSRALGNLLDNAKKHADGAAQLVVRKGDAGHAVFEVLDRGPGIPDEALLRIFEPFERAGEKKAEGLGLGLNLVKRIAEAHRGTAFARNREGGGAIVGISLPLT